MTLSAKELLEIHTQRFGQGDIEGLLSEYDPNVVVFTQNGVLRGASALRPLFEAMIEEFSMEGVSFELLSMHADGDHGYMTWKAETPKNSYLLGSDTFVLAHGKIVMQSSAILAHPKA